ncbi:hypothetical protein PQX77_021660 [Marasmius sp. AFHP31]|nr:hypothetical protein PQX77_021660 [Marasmius sp. AFHP31]
MQNLSYGRDQNLNNGSGAMTINNRGTRSPSRYPPRTKNNNERAGRGHLATTTRTPIRYLEGPTASLRPNSIFANPRPSSGKPLTPEKLRREESAFRQLLTDSEQYEDVLAADGDDAQEVLNDWQRVCFGRLPGISDTELRPKIARMIIKLSDSSGLFPQCLWIEEVDGLSKSPAEFGGSADTWTGSINGVRVAIKVVRHRINPEKREQVVKAFTREAMVWRNLNHPNILPFTGMYWFNGYQELVCLVCPQMENGNLLQFLKDHPELDPATHLRLAKDVAQGLAYLHDLKIIHGDLNSYNVLIAPDGTACISDLGLSRAMDADKATGLSATLSYWRPVRWLAPERLTNGERSITSPEGDIYAFGRSINHADRFTPETFPSKTLRSIGFTTSSWSRDNALNLRLKRHTRCGD